jgi:hypothetical protein
VSTLQNSNMKTVIVSNGSHWAGEDVSSMDELFDALNDYALDRRFEEFGNFVEPYEHDDAHIYVHYGFGKSRNVFHFFGNFLNLSHVFSIFSDDSALVNRLSEAINKNKLRGDYLSQKQPDLRKQCTRCRTRESASLCRIGGRRHSQYLCGECLPLAIQWEADRFYFPSEVK